MDIATDIFKRKSYKADKLLQYGFTETDGKFEYSARIMNGKFSLAVTVSGNEVTTDVIELSTGEPFALYRVDGTSGPFVGQMRAEAEKILLDVADKCFHPEVFKSAQAKTIIEYAMQKYGNAAEYLWQKFPDNAVLRRTDNNKWYAALLTVERAKLGLSGDGTVEIVDLREEPDALSALLDGKTYFAGYHMNKKHWYTICLDDSVSDDELKARIDKSHSITH